MKGHSNILLKFLIRYQLLMDWCLAVNHTFHWSPFIQRYYIINYFTILFII